MPAGVYQHKPYQGFQKGHIVTAEMRIKLSKAYAKRLVHPRLGKIHTEETKRKIGEKSKGRTWPESSRRALSERMCGGNNRNWKTDRTTLVKRQERNDMAYQDWRKQVWSRDNFKCRIANSNCSGRIEAHHILIWSEYPELRYKVNNGITLCHAHHPRKRAEEKQLVPYFMGLVETKV